jgi:hypothetical protein
MPRNVRDVDVDGSSRIRLAARPNKLGKVGCGGSWIQWVRDGV